jgi:O-antigen ligase
MTPSLFLYLVTGMLAPAMGFTGVFATLGYWGVLTARHGIAEGRVAVPRFVYILIPSFVAAVALGARGWRHPYDLKDPLALLLYFAVVPWLLCVLALRDPGWLPAAWRTVRALFALLSAGIVLWAVAAGVDWQRNYVLIPALHKNAVAATYEVLLLAVMLERRHGGARAAVAGIGLACLTLVGSRTALALAALATSIVLLRWWGVALAAGAAAAGAAAAAAAATSALTLESPFRNVALRLVLWAQAWEEITASTGQFWLGVGPGTFAPLLDLPGLGGIESPHNMVLQWWHSYGLLGLLILLAFFLWIARRFGIARSPFLAGFWLFNLHALFDVGWVKGAGFVASAALGLGIADAIRQQRSVVQLDA